MVAWRSFFYLFRGAGGPRLEGFNWNLVGLVGPFGYEGAVAAKRCQKITVRKSVFGVEKWHNLIFQGLLRRSSIGCAKCQSGGAFDEFIKIFNRRQSAMSTKVQT